MTTVGAWLIAAPAFAAGVAVGVKIGRDFLRPRRPIAWDATEEPSEHGPFGGTPLAFPDAPRVPSRPAAFDAFPAALTVPGHHRPTVAGWSVPRDERGPR